MRSIFSKTFYQLSFTNFLCIFLSLGFAKISIYLFQEILSLVKIQKNVHVLLCDWGSEFY